MRIEIEVEAELFRFASKQDWINNASELFAEARHTLQLRSVEGSLCVDSAGRVCAAGSEFSRAEREGTYPIVVYRVCPVRG